MKLGLLRIDTLLGGLNLLEQDNVIRELNL